jgi:hypothetical protein
MTCGNLSPTHFSKFAKDDKGEVNFSLFACFTMCLSNIHLKKCQFVEEETPTKDATP